MPTRKDKRKTKPRVKRKKKKDCERIVCLQAGARWKENAKMVPTGWREAEGECRLGTHQERKRKKPG